MDDSQEVVLRPVAGKDYLARNFGYIDSFLYIAL